MKVRISIVIIWLMIAGYQQKNQTMVLTHLILDTKILNIQIISILGSENTILITAKYNSDCLINNSYYRCHWTGQQK